VTTGWMPADPLLSLLVVLLLVRSGWILVREAGLILLEAAPRHLDRNRIADDIAAHTQGVADVHHMHVWSLDGKQLMATLHARLDDGANAEASIAAIKLRLAKVHGIGHATVEVESGGACPEMAGKWRANGTA